MDMLDPAGNWYLQGPWSPKGTRKTGKTTQDTGFGRSTLKQALAIRRKEIGY